MIEDGSTNQGYGSIVDPPGAGNQVGEEEQDNVSIDSDEFDKLGDAEHDSRVVRTKVSWSLITPKNDQLNHHSYITEENDWLDHQTSLKRMTDLITKQHWTKWLTWSPFIHHWTEWLAW